MNHLNLYGHLYFSTMLESTQRVTLYWCVLRCMLSPFWWNYQHTSISVTTSKLRKGNNFHLCVVSLTFFFLYRSINELSGLKETHHWTSFNPPLNTSFKSIFWPGDLDLWPMTLTYNLALDIHPLDVHAKNQCLHVCSLCQESDTPGKATAKEISASF